MQYPPPLFFSLLFVGLATAPARAAADPDAPAPLPHPRSVHDRVFEVWRNPGRFTKNPDIIELPSGRLMLVYSDTEKHLSQEDQHLVLLVSDDQGQTWRKHAVVDSHDKRKGEERLVTPRLSRLNDGRLVVLIDQDDWGHFHEDQPSGILAYWSTDNGETWSEPQLMPRVKGFEPDRMIDLPDGSLGFAAHVVRGESQEFADVLDVSKDGGRTWHEGATIAHDGYHRFVEGPSSCSTGGGRSPASCARTTRRAFRASSPFPATAVARGANRRSCPSPSTGPTPNSWPDGRVLVTGRNVLGGLGTYGWTGDLRKEAGLYAAGGPAAPAAMQLTPGSRPELHRVIRTMRLPEVIRAPQATLPEQNPA